MLRVSVVEVVGFIGLVVGLVAPLCQQLLLLLKAIECLLVFLQNLIICFEKLSYVDADLLGEQEFAPRAMLLVKVLPEPNEVAHDLQKLGLRLVVLEVELLLLLLLPF